MVSLVLISTISAFSVPVQADDPKDVDTDEVYEMGHGQGDFIFFDLNESTGVISDFGLNTTEGEKVLLENISIEGFVPDDISVLGSLIKVSGENGSVVLHDNPTGLVHLFMDDDVEMTIILAGDLRVIEEKELDDDGNYSHQLVISDGRSEGMIGSDDRFDISENGTKVRCESDDLMVKFLPQLTIHQNWRERLLMQAIQDGQVATEVTLSTNGGRSSYDLLSYDQQLKVKVQDVRRNSFQFYVGGDNDLGAVLLIRTDEGTMDLTERPRIMIDGQRIPMVEEPMELLFEEPETACFGAFTENGVHQMVVFLPAGTLGTLTVEGVEPLSALLTPLGLTMVLGAIGLVALAAVAVFRRF